MILRKSREYTVNMGNYESVKIGAAIEIDTKELVEVPDKEVDVMGFMDKYLDNMIAEDVKEAAELTTTRDSFILSWGKK